MVLISGQWFVTVRVHVFSSRAAPCMRGSLQARSELMSLMPGGSGCDIKVGPGGNLVICGLNRVSFVVRWICLL